MAAKGCNTTCVKKVHFLEGDSRECLSGDEWFWLQVGSPRTEDEMLLSYPLYENILNRRSLVSLNLLNENPALCKIATLFLL